MAVGNGEQNSARAKERLRGHLSALGKLLLLLTTVPIAATFLTAQAAMFAERSQRATLARLEIAQQEARTDLGDRLRAHDAPMEEIDRQMAMLDGEQEDERRRAKSFLPMLLGPLAVLTAGLSVVAEGIAFLVVVVAASMFVYRRAMRARMRRFLLDRGYEWATAEDALWLMLRLGRRAWALPPAEETTVIPGVAANVDGLLAFERMRRMHRRRGEEGA